MPANPRMGAPRHFPYVEDRETAPTEDRAARQILVSVTRRPFIFVAVRCCNRREFYSPVREMHLRAILVADQTPPSTLMVSPLTKDARSLARKTATPAISDGRPSRPRAIVCSILRRASGGMGASTSIGPGATTFTRRPRGPSSLANDRVRPTSPAFDAV